MGESKTYLISIMSSNFQIRPKHSYRVDELLSLRSVTTPTNISKSKEFKRLELISEKVIKQAEKPYNKNQGEFKTKDELCEEISRNVSIGGIFRNPIVVGKPNYGNNNSSFDSDSTSTSSSSSSTGKRKTKTKKSSPLVPRKNQSSPRGPSVFAPMSCRQSLQVQKTLETDHKLFNAYPNSRLRRQRLTSAGHQ